MMFINDSYLKPTANNLTLTRLILADSVIYTHCFVVIAGDEIDRDNLSWLLGAPISTYGVDGFFFLSGFLVYRSLATSRSVPRFALARLTRLWPGLFVMIALLTLIGLFVTTSPPAAYLRGHETVRFVLGNLSFLQSNYTLTNVRCGPQLCNVNRSLWTLPWELRCYIVLALLGLFGLANRRWMLRFVLPATAIAAIGWCALADPLLGPNVLSHGLAYNLDRFDRLWTAFALGILAYELRERIPLSWALLALVVAVDIAIQMLLPARVGLHFHAITAAYLALCLGFLTARRGVAISARWPDFSYGMYIYGAPTMVLAYELFGIRDRYLLILVNIALTVPIAAASWHFVEKPALDWLRRRQKTAFRAKPPQEHPEAGIAVPGPAAEVR